MSDSVEVCAICDIAGCRHIRERAPAPTYTPAEVEAIARAAYRAALEDAAIKAENKAARKNQHALSQALRDAILALSVPTGADILDRAKGGGE